MMNITFVLTNSGGLFTKGYIVYLNALQNHGQNYMKAV